MSRNSRPRVALAVCAIAAAAASPAQVTHDGALAGWTVVDWMGKKRSERLPGGGSVVVLADEIEWEGTTSESPRNPRVVLIADHLRVTGPARINASGLGTGNDVAIVARRLTCEGGTLEVDVTGRDVTQRNMDRPGPSYKNFRAADPQQCRDACMADDRCRAWSHAPPPAGFVAGIVAQVRHCLLKEHVRPSVRDDKATSGVKPAPGTVTVAFESETPPGGCIAPRFTPAGPPVASPAVGSGYSRIVGPEAFTQFLARAQTLARPQRDRLLSAWVTRWLAWKATRVKEAIGRPDHRQAISLLAGARTLADSQRYPIVPEDRAAFADALDALDEQGRAIPAFIVEPIPVTTALGERMIDVWLETRTGTAYVPPTLLLVEPIAYAGKRGLAYLSFDAARPDQLVLQVNARLAQDPLVAEQVRKELAGKGWKAGGLVPGWRYEAELVPVFGVRDQKIVQSGDGVEVSLTLDASQGNVALTRLVASGIDVNVKVSGSDSVSTTVRVPLSLGRAAHLNGVEMAPGLVTNKGTLPVRIGYVEAADGAIRALDRPVEVAPGQSASLPAGFADARSVPPGGAEYRLDPLRLLDYVVAADASPLVETITVTNLLGPDPQRGGVLEYVEVDIEYTSGDGPPVRIESLRLASRGTMDSERRLSFLRAPGERKVRVAGRAYYEGGSSQTIGPVTFSSAAIKITEESFAGS